MVKTGRKTSWRDLPVAQAGQIGYDFLKRQKKQFDKQEKQCPAGYYYDAATDSCIKEKQQEQETTNKGFMTDEKTGQEKQEDKPLKDGFMTDPETGEVTGMIKNGNTYYFQGLSNSEKKAIINAELNKIVKLPEGVESIADREQRLKSEEKAGQISETIGDTSGMAPQPLSPTQLSTEELQASLITNLGTSALTGAAGFIGGGIAGGGSATGGAGASGALGGGALPIATGLIGFLGDMANAATRNMKQQRQGNLADQSKTLTDGKSNLMKWIRAANKEPDLEKKEEYINNFNTQLWKIEQAHRQMQIDVDNDPNLLLGSATVELGNFKRFFEETGQKDYLVASMKQAMYGELSDEELYALMEQELYE